MIKLTISHLSDSISKVCIHAPINEAAESLVEYTMNVTGGSSNYSNWEIENMIESTKRVLNRTKATRSEVALQGMKYEVIREKI